MSVAGIFSGNLNAFEVQNTPSRFQQFRQDFQQLGQDLGAGNLSAAQADFANLQQLSPQANAVSSNQNPNPIAQAFSQLSQDLQAGNLPAAQQDFSSLQQDIQSQVTQAHHHHHHGGGAGQGPVAQLFNQLGQDLQTGNVGAAQQAYSSLQQAFQQIAQNGAGAGASGQPGSASVSVSV
ncbi:MAG TPA: hypothetical protein VL099_15455 [Candidatus Binatia bacterium]|nr:hypothetical protein [Candidatus Binatia bacterium]